MGIPTRDELFAEVDRTFRDWYPDAPRKLSRSGSHDAAYREAWLRIRDQTLESEVNRIYWERFPDGPMQIDPENPDHNHYVNGWLEIRDAIMSNTPLAPDDDDEDHDFVMSYVRADLNVILLAWLPATDPEHHQRLTEFCDVVFYDIRDAVTEGSIPLHETWWAPRTVTCADADARYPRKIEVGVRWDGGLLRCDYHAEPDWDPEDL
jgi:hypothetical protein